MNKIFINSLITLLLFPSFSSAEAAKGYLNKSFDTFAIRIISPYGCYEEVRLTKFGLGMYKSGLHDGNSEAENITLTSLYVADSFFVRRAKDLKKLNKLIASLKGDSIRGNFKYDAYRFQASIDGIQKVDVYGNTVSINEILKILIKYLPLSNAKCEFLKLYNSKSK
jgi:hypothetical protein